MAISYQAVLWNRQKRRYDLVMLGLIVLFLGLFIGLQASFYPEITAETLIIRASGSLALTMLHVILLIGPMSRINPRWLPVLYNRRHLGVSMFLFALIHGVFSIIQFHALGDLNPIASIFLSNTHYGSLLRFPFQPLGFFALIILFLMAATSHDFWLHNLSPRIWKALHMMVYVAYALVVMHVMLGVVQLESANWGIWAMLIGMIVLIGLHLRAAFGPKNHIEPTLEEAGFVKVCTVDEIKEDCAKVVLTQGENIAIFKYDGKLSAVNNICKHQNGPLGEGKIVDGCITCPWHGYQYRPEDGQSPPPFKEKVTTYDVKLIGDDVWVHPQPHPEGTFREPVVITK
ncbi:MAG: Rieske 2Fe-2S domain-containing protein [Bacteroidota bacterium]